MTQIKQNQIIPTRVVQVNPSSAPPKDLILLTTENTDNPDSTNPAPQVVNTSPLNDAIGVQTPTTLPDQIVTIPVPPQVPAIIGIKSQQVNQQDDGSSTIDIVLIVEDIPGITEYDIRLAKLSDNL